MNAMDVARGCLLVTGADGFLGSQVVSRAIRAGYRVWRLGRRVQGERAIAADLTSPGDWQKQVREACPDGVIHLAGLTRGQDIQLLDRVHIGGTRNLMAALEGIDTWFAVASSGAVYGEAMTDSLPWSETKKCQPLGAYAQSKYKQEQAALEAKPESARLCIVRIANLVGPGQSEEFFLGRIINAIARLSHSESEHERILETGSLAATRDFIDVRDAADALLALLERRAEGIFNLASGHEVQLRDVTMCCLKLFGAMVRLQENLAMHVSPISRQVLDNGALTAATGWQSTYTLQQTLSDMVAAASEVSGCS